MHPYLEPALWCVACVLCFALGYCIGRVDAALLAVKLTLEELQKHHS